MREAAVVPVGVSKSAQETICGMGKQQLVIISKQTIIIFCNTVIRAQQQIDCRLDSIKYE